MGRGVGHGQGGSTSPEYGVIRSACEGVSEQTSRLADEQTSRRTTEETGKRGDERGKRKTNARKCEDYDKEFAFQGSRIIPPIALPALAGVTLAWIGVLVRSPLASWLVVRES